MKAMIFAAGMGKRLGMITETIPKPLVDINGKTLLHHAVEKCSSFGFNDIIINVHHFAEMVEAEIEHLKKIGFMISVSDERGMLLETGGGLFKARGFFDDKPFLLYNADIISDMDLSALYNYHLENNRLATLATLAVRHRPGNRFYLINNSGRICGWRNRATGEEILTVPSDKELSEIAFSSMQIVEPEIFNYMSEGVYTMTDLYLRLSSKHNIFTFLDDSGYWENVGTPESLESARNHFRNIR